MSQIMFIQVDFKTMVRFQRRMPGASAPSRKTIGNATRIGDEHEHHTENST